MRYFKHTDLVKTYHVSLRTVHNWIDAAKRGKTALTLHQTDGRTYIADTPKNTLILQQLSQKGKKFRNTLHYRVVEPAAEFYEIYSRRQILDIITNLSVHREIPRQYNYFQQGAVNWDNWLQRLATEEASNILKGTVELIRTNIEALDRLLNGATKINIIDLGVGNAYPVKELLGHLIERQLLHRYIAIDISPAMLSVAEKNIRGWYGEKVRFEGYVRDISYEHFDDLLVDDMLKEEAEGTINLVLLLGGTPANFREFDDVFKAIYSSMGGKDLLLYTDKPDTEASRHYFDFNSAPHTNNQLSPNHKYILDLLGIDESFYDAEMGYDETRRMRYIRARLKSPVVIRFVFGSIVRTVELERGETILLLRVWHRTVLEIISEFDRAGFTLVHSSVTKDRQFFLSISGLGVKDQSY